MKIGFIKQMWHDPAKVVPTVAYKIYDMDNYTGWPEHPYTLRFAGHQLGDLPK